MKTSELPEDQKYYELELSNKRSYTITGLEKIKIMRSTAQFIEISTGDVVNKSHIVSITLDKAYTKEKFLASQESKLLS